MIHFPSKCRIYEFTDARGVGIARVWSKQISRDKDLLARFHQKVDLLAQNGTDLPPGLLAGTRFKHIDKLRIFGKKTVWRVMVCKDLFNNKFEFTILYIAQEKDRKLIPPDADKRANENRIELISKPSRRQIYEQDN
jgi:hypothetical protein